MLQVIQNRTETFETEDLRQDFIKLLYRVFSSKSVHNLKKFESTVGFIDKIYSSSLGTFDHKQELQVLVILSQILFDLKNCQLNANRVFRFLL